jgi:ribose transport system permease protein
MRARRFGTLIGLVALCAVLWALTPHFLTFSNLLNIAQQTSINAIVAVGMTFVIVSGGIDLSVGSIVALSGVALGLALHADQPVVVALAAALAVGIACGQVNGLLIDRGGLPPFIVTLGTMSMARGAALVMTEGRPVSGFDAGFRALATSTVGFIPAPIIVMVVVYALAHLVLTRTTFGRYVYAIGGNEEATRLSGVRVHLHKPAIYAVSGPADCGHDVRARRDCGHGDRRYQPHGRRRYTWRNAHWGAYHGCPAKRTQSAWRVVVPSADCDWRRHCRRRPD